MNVNWAGIFSEQVYSREEQYRNRIDRSHYFANVDFDRRGIKIPLSILSGRKLLYFLDRSTAIAAPQWFASSLPRRYRAVAADIATGDRVVIESGSLADAMRASMGIPGIFAPYLLEKRHLVDGGIVDNLPVGTARELGADLIIAVDIIGGTPFSLESIERNPMDAMGRSLDILIRAKVRQQLLDADLVLTINLTGISTVDFLKTKEIIALGEEAVRAQSVELEAFKIKLGVLSPHEADIYPRPQTPIQRLVVEGGDAKDRTLVYRLFGPIIGTIPDPRFLKKTVDALEAEGIYDSIRIRRSNEDSIPTFVVLLKRGPKPGHTLHLGTRYTSTYSGSSASNFILSSSVVFRDLTGENSRLALSLALLDSPAFDVSFVQPISTNIFVESVFGARQKVETYGNDSTINYLYQTGALDIGFNVGVNPVKWMEISAGWSYEWLQSDPVPDIRTGGEIKSAPMAHVLFALHRFDSPIFPVKGAAALFRYDQSLFVAGTSRVFRSLVNEGVYIPDFNIPLSFTLWAKVGSDFSEYADGSNAAPPQYKPGLTDRHFFSGPLEVYERIGSHVAGSGAEIKYQLNWATRAIGFPSFIMVQVAAGTVLQDIEDIKNPSTFTHWDGAVGVGARVNDGFGVSFRVGVSRGFDLDFKPFIAFDLGAIGY
ncbi:hypothetical protein MASR2M78_23810 [Treponema sp.]